MKKRIKSIIKKNQYIEKISYQVYNLTLKKFFIYLKRKRLQKKGLKILLNIDNVFKELNKTYWIDFGTLLGAYRDKNFISHDVDIDIGMYLKDFKEEDNLIFEKYGFKKVREFIIDNGEYGREITYSYENVNIDIFFYTRINNSYAYFHDFIVEEGFDFYEMIEKKGGLIPREIILPLKGITYIEFLGHEFPAPSPIEDHLRERYGKNFMKKDPNWKWDKMYNKNIKILKHKIGIVKIYV